MGDFDALKGAVDGVFRCCFSGTLEQVKAAVEKLLTVDSPEIKQQFEDDISRQKTPKDCKDTLFTCLELSALESLRDSKRHTVAHVAAAGGNLHVLQALITASPNLAHVVDENGENPLFYAIRAAQGLEYPNETCTSPTSDRIDCLYLLLGHCGANSTSKNGATPLHIAAELGDLPICKILIENHADVNLTSEYGTPLSVAAIRGYLDVVEFLLNNGASPDGISSDSSSACKGLKTFPPPLVYSASIGNLELIKLLIDHGANVNIGDSEGWTPLHCAAECGYMEVVNFLISCGAECNIKVEDKNAYHMAILNGKCKVAEVLRKHTHATDIPDFTPHEQQAECLTSDDEIVCPEEGRDDLLREVEAIKSKGNDSVSRGDLEGAAAEYSKALKLCPRDSGDFSNLRSTLYANRSLVNLKLENLDAALSDANKAIKYNPEWSKAHYRKARVYKAKGESVDYVYFLFEAFKRDSENEGLKREFQFAFNSARNH